MLKNKVKKAVVSFAIMILKPFIVPIIIIVILLAIVCSVTDILYIAFNHEEESNIKEELAYYDTEYKRDEAKSFFDSVWDFVEKIFGGGDMAKDADWPVEGQYTITSYFGKRDAPTAGASTMHSGIDIAAPEGSKLVCIMDGEVTSVGWGGAGGYTITIESTDGVYKFSYCHCSPEFIVSVGQNVKKGEIIGKVGPKNVYGVTNNPYKDSNGNPTNGATTGCHCHFTVRKNGELIDPLEILKEREVLVA